MDCGQEINLKRMNMNRINKISAFLISGLLMAMSFSCSDDDNWSPGPEPSSENPLVCFDKSNPASFELELDGNDQLSQDYVTVTMRRDVSKSGSAISVPITTLSADDNLVIPQTVEFAAGSTTAELKINITEYKGEPASFSIEIDQEKYFSQYLDGYYQYTGQIKVLIVITATFTPTDYSSSTAPEFVPFEQLINDNQDGTYTIKNFLYNNAGYDFTFSLDDNNNIIPALTEGYHSTGDNRWYFYSANSDASANRIPCYLPGANSEDYITYIYFYTVENTSSYQAFWLDTATKSGRMMGYARYSKSTLGRIAFNISW